MYRIGVDLGGTYIKTGITDGDYRLMADSAVETDLELGPEAVVRKMASEIDRLIKKCGLEMDQLTGIGVSSPGIIDKDTGTVIYSNNFGWEGFHLRDALIELTGSSVTVKNDALCAVMGELKAGAAKGLKDVVMLTLGTGVGSGITVDGKVFEGGGSGGIAGHIIVEKEGRMCTCGRRGCLEAYASATALIVESVKAMKDHPDSMIAVLCDNDPAKINGKTPFDAAEAGDMYARAIVEEFMDALANGIADLINIFRPEVVLLGGGISNQGEKLLSPLNERVKKLCYGGEKVRIPEIKRATLGTKAGIIGAAALTEQEDI